MKKTAAILVLMVLAFSAMAMHPNTSVLNISLHDQAVFNITINGQSFNHRATSYSIPDLRPGRHFVEIVRYEKVFTGRNYVLAHPRVIFADYIRVPARSIVTGHINHRQRFVETSRMARHQPAPRPVQPVYGAPHHGYHGPAVMSPVAFAHLKHTLEQARFDSNRLQIARQAAASNNLTSHQVMEIMMSFSFESNRLEFAKFAYPYTVDPHNYFVVNRAFSFSSSTNNLNRYIARNF
jgi:hypothetical protein